MMYTVWVLDEEILQFKVVKETDSLEEAKTEANNYPFAFVYHRGFCVHVCRFVETEDHSFSNNIKGHIEYKMLALYVKYQKQQIRVLKTTLINLLESREESLEEEGEIF